MDVFALQLGQQIEFHSCIRGKFYSNENCDHWIWRCRHGID